MSKSIDDTNELESYGVWVKQPNKADNEVMADAETTDELDLPDFDDSDFSDMFKDENEFSTDAAENNSFADDDTTLTIDELQNITNTAETSSEESSTPADDAFDLSFEEPAEQPEATAEDNLNLDDFNLDEIKTDDFNFDETSVEEPNEEVTETTADFEMPEVQESAEETPLASDDFDISFDEIKDGNSDESTEEPASEDGEISLDDFGFSMDEEPASAETQTTFDAAAATDSGEEEVSLDDFMDTGFSDESVASGNNGFEAGKEIPVSASDSEEISLDDFIDTSSESFAPQEKTDEIKDEEPISMDLSFDDSVDNIETEDNSYVADDVPEEEEASETEKSTEETEEISLDDFGASSTGSNDIEAESIDLSDFGIDSDAEETPVTQNVNDAKKNESKIDYDLTVGNANMSSAPVVNEIKDAAEDVDEVEAVEEVEEIPQEEKTESISTSLLQQIVNDLSGLKNEINQLKSNLADMQANGVTANKAEESVVEEKEESGFFAEDDGDETIALSGDELNNIFNTAQFSEETTEPEVNDSSLEEPVIEETAVQDDELESTLPDTAFTSYENEEEKNEFVTEETTDSLDTFDLPEEITIPKFEDTSTSASDNFMDNIEAAPAEEPVIEETSEPVIENEEPVIEETLVTENEPVTEEISENSDIEDSIFVEPESTTENEEVASTSEPTIDESLFNVNEAENTPFETADNLFEENSTEVENTEEPDVDSIFVEAESDESTSETVTEPVIEDSSENFTGEAEAISETASEETKDTEDEQKEETVSFDNVDSFIDVEAPAEEPVIETTENDEPMIEETAVSEEALGKDDSFAALDDTNNDISESNLAYLTKDNEENSSTEVNAELKQDIKSVLLYMDQLLENLPEEKIIEFAKSDEFTTYKKLFSELGLS